MKSEIYLCKVSRRENLKKISREENLEKEKEKVKLDQVLKFLFSTSHKVLVNLLNGVFEEDFDYNEVELKVTNNEFVDDSMDILRGDMFFDIMHRGNEAGYHIEFQTKNDSTMIVRMFEYGFKKGKEKHNYQKNNKNDDGVKTIYIPRQKVIFFEKNKNIDDNLDLKIVFPNDQEVLYTVPVMKYWEYTDEDLIEKKMYPLIPLQLFKIRKDLDYACRHNDKNKIDELSQEARKLAIKLANESRELFEQDKILGDDFHKLLLGIQNLIEYLNRNYLNDNEIEEEMIAMTKTLIDPEVEKKGIEKGKSELLIKQLFKKFKHLPDGYEEKIKKLSPMTLDEIATDIFDLEKAEDLERYFKMK